MPTYITPEWTHIFLQPDGSWTRSYFKAHDNAICFRDYGDYYAPTEWFE